MVSTVTWPEERLRTPVASEDNGRKSGSLPESGYAHTPGVVRYTRWTPGSAGSAWLTPMPAGRSDRASRTCRLGVRTGHLVSEKTIYPAMAPTPCSAVLPEQRPAAFQAPFTGSAVMDRPYPLTCIEVSGTTKADPLARRSPISTAVRGGRGTAGGRRCSCADQD